MGKQRAFKTESKYFTGNDSTYTWITSTTSTSDFWVTGVPTYTIHTGQIGYNAINDSLLSFLKYYESYNPYKIKLRLNPKITIL